jgi:putative PIN family toxin of toxin-antitoxin system
MPPKAVLDASVLVSAHLFPSSIPGRTLQLARERRISVQLSPILIAETRYALLSTRLQRAYRLDQVSVEAWLHDLCETGTVLSARLPDIGQVCRDPNDDHVLALAVASGAGTIVTGDKDLLSIEQFQTVMIRTARDFLAQFEPPDR